MLRPLCVNTCSGIGVVYNSPEEFYNLCICDILYRNSNTNNGCECTHYIGIDGEKCVEKCSDNAHMENRQCKCNFGYIINDDKCIRNIEFCKELEILYNG